MTTDQWRVQFDADVKFANGGALQAQEFRLDIPGADITDADLAELFVRHLGLLMVGSVEISNKMLIQELHKGSRGVSGTVQKRRLVELSHPIVPGMITVPILPGPKIAEFISHAESRPRYAPGTEFHFPSIEMCGNTGTYVDAPLHRFEGGTDLAGVPLEKLADLEGVVVRAEGVQEVTRDLLLPLDVQGKAVIIHTGWSKHWGTEQYFTGHPYLTEEAADWLIEQGAAMVATDTQNVDGIKDGHRPIHTNLLRAGIPICEHMTNLDQLPPHGFRFHAAPPLFQGVGTFSVRAYAVITAE